jgi:hypothetical protein
VVGQLRRWWKGICWIVTAWLKTAEVVDILNNLSCSWTSEELSGGRGEVHRNVKSKLSAKAGAEAAIGDRPGGTRDLKFNSADFNHLLAVQLPVQSPLYHSRWTFRQGSMGASGVARRKTYRRGKQLTGYVPDRVETLLGTIQGSLKPTRVDLDRLQKTRFLAVDRAKVANIVSAR